MSSELTFRALTLPTLRNTGAEQIEAQARTRGHAAGYAAGLRDAQKQLLEQRAALDAEHAEMIREGCAAIERSLELLAAAVRATDAQILPILTDAEEVLAVSAMDLAEAVVGHELSTGDLSARSALARALWAVPPTGLTSIHLNPDDLAALDAESRDRAAVTLVADATLERGDAIAILPDGIIDAHIGTALSRARAALLGDDS